MSNLPQQQPGQVPETAKGLFQSPTIKAKFEELLGKRSSAFMTSVLQIVSQNELLKNADPQSIYQAAAMAATLDLPLNNNLGFAYIVPYSQSVKVNGEWVTKQVAQFQIGYKGFIQLAQRSGQMKTISASPIYKGQLVEENPLTGFVFDFSIKASDTIIGYAAYFRLLNGFEKTLYMPLEKAEKHGKKFSKTYQKDKGLWKDDFDGMAMKTVVKLLLSKYAPLSVDMQSALIADQSIIKDSQTLDAVYVDNEHSTEAINPEEDRVRQMLQDCKSILEVDALQIKNPDIDIEVFKARKEELKNGL